MSLQTTQHCVAGNMLTTS